jgi:hypothetical protein
MQKFGIANLILVTGIVGTLGTHVWNIYKDKKINLDDIPEGISLVTDLIDVKNIDFAMLDDEVKDLDMDEKSQLDLTFVNAFNIEADTLEERIELGMKLVTAGLIFLGYFLKPKPEALPA